MPTILLIELATDEEVRTLVVRVASKGIESSSQLLFVAEQGSAGHRVPGALVALRFAERQMAVAFASDLESAEVDERRRPRVRLFATKRSPIDNLMPLLFP